MPAPRTSGPRLLWGVRGGGTRPPLNLAALAVGLALAGAVGCGGGGVAGGATVHVYASASLSGPGAAAGERFCAAARQRLRDAGGRAGEVRVRLTCLDEAARPGHRWRLAAIGANARRATEDSAAVAYLGEPEPAAARFSRPILEAAGIGQVAGADGGAAMGAVLRALREAGDAGDLRAEVESALEGA